MPKIEEELQEEEIENSEDAENEEAPPIEEDIDEDAYSVVPTLSVKQKLLLILGGVFTFLTFLVLLFPLEEFIRSQISKASSQKGYYIDFKRLKIPVFGSKTVDSLNIQSPDGLGIKTEEIEINSSLYNIIQGSFIGTIQANSVKLDKKEISLNLKSILFEGKLASLTEGFNEINGSLMVQAANGTLTKVPILPLIGELKDTAIKNISILMKLKNGRIHIEKGVLDTSIGKISFKGKIEYTGNFGNSRIDMEICPRLSASFSAERPDLSDMLQVVSKGNPDFCVPIQGTVDQPKANISLMGDQNLQNQPSTVLPPVAPNLPVPKIPQPPQKK